MKFKVGDHIICGNPNYEAIIKIIHKGNVATGIVTKSPRYGQQIGGPITDIDLSLAKHNDAVQNQAKLKKILKVK